MSKYEVIGSVGEGNYGVVLKCRNAENGLLYSESFSDGVGEMVAIKKFKESEDDAGVKKTTLREVKLLRMLRHDNIVQLKEAFRRNGKLYLVFEFVDRNLLELLTEYYPRGCDTELVRSTIFQVIRAIEYCHRHDVVHRDVKPENILVNLTDMTVKLCDFGFARSIPIPNDQPLTDYVATRWYRAPELLIGSVFYGPEVDVFAIGCLMCEVADGEPLLPGDSEIAQLGLIQRVVGPLSADQLESFASNPRFVGMRIPLAPMHGKVLSLEERYDARINRRGVFLLRSLLAVDPALRITANRALCDSFFDGIYQQPKLGIKARLARPATVSSTGPRANYASITKKLASLHACPPRHAAPALQAGRSQLDKGFPTCNR